jgi:hypothetical protein
MHEALFAEILAIYAKYGADIPAIEILAIMCNIVGKLVALQDQRRYTPDQIMRLVAKNIEHGNAEALGGLSQTKGSA